MDFKLHKISQKCPIFKGFRGRIVKKEGYKIKRKKSYHYWTDWQNGEAFWQDAPIIITD